MKTYDLGRWGIVDGPLLREIMDMYLLDPRLENKVLEVQNLLSLRDNPENHVRVFFGRGINIKDADEDQLDWLVGLKKRLTIKMNLLGLDTKEIPDLVDFDFAMCMWERGSKITPIQPQSIGDSKNSLSFKNSAVCLYGLGDTFLTSEEIAENFPESELKDRKSLAKIHMAFWFYIDKDGKYVLPAFNEREAIMDGLVPKFRIRSMELDTWREMTKDYKDNGNVCPEFVRKDDIKPTDMNLNYGGEVYIS